MRDRALFDPEQLVRFTAKKSNYAVPHVKGIAIAVFIFDRRRNKGPHRGFFLSPRNGECFPSPAAISAPADFLTRCAGKRSRHTDRSTDSAARPYEAKR